MTRILFDTLNYATLLKNGGIEKADLHASSLLNALSQNIYTKDEVDVRIERAIHQLEKTLDRRCSAIELLVEKKLNRYLIVIVSTVAGLLTVFQTIAAFTHLH